MATEKDPTPFIVDQQRALLSRWPFGETHDVQDAERGPIAALEPCVIRAEDGRVVWDNGSYSFLRGEARGRKSGSGCDSGSSRSQLESFAR